jgi:HlyD family secretion protein
LLVPNAALRYKPADSEAQNLPANPSPAANPGSDAQKNASSRPGGSRGGKPKDAKQLSGHPRDTFAGKVYVLENGKLRPVSVTLGITDNRNTEIVGGELKAGVPIVIGEEQANDKSTSSSSRPPMRLF